MSQVPPTVRYLIVCDDVRVDAQKTRGVSLLGLVSALEATQQPAFPYTHKELCAYVQITECRGPAEGRIEIQNADSGAVVFRGRDHPLPLPSDPLKVIGFTFRLRNCPFPDPGLYWFQFWYNNQMLAAQGVLLR